MKNLLSTYIMSIHQNYISVGIDDIKVKNNYFVKK